MFYPAAIYKEYSLFLTALFVLGLGFTLLQIAANPYVAILGRPETASSRLNMSQAFNSFGTTIAPIIGGYLVFHFFTNTGTPLFNSRGEAVLTDTGATLSASGITVPYMIFSAIFLLMAIIFRFIKLPDMTSGEKTETGLGALRYRHLVLGMIAIFLYVGAEVSIGSMLINYLGELMGYPEVKAKSFLAFYWGGAMIGRFLGAISLSGMSGSVKKYLSMAVIAMLAFALIYAAVYIENGLDFDSVAPFLILLTLNYLAFMAGKSLPGRTLMIFALIIIVLLFTTIFATSEVAKWSVIGIGLFNSIMWSNIFTLSISGLGKYTSQGSSLLVMAILGGALLPVIQGSLADITGLQFSFVVPVISYIYIAYYGFRGYKPLKIAKK
jgi:FHS family L-fucose permease-like MFS transporter